MGSVAVPMPPLLPPRTSASICLCAFAAAGKSDADRSTTATTNVVMPLPDLGAVTSFISLRLRGLVGAHLFRARGEIFLERVALQTFQSRDDGRGVELRAGRARVRVVGAEERPDLLFARRLVLVGDDGRHVY